MLLGLLLQVGALAALSADDAAAQVDRTLQNLLATVEDEGKQAEERAAPRRSWCASQIQAAQNQLADLQDEAAQASADVSEVEAAADEISAAAESLRRELKGKEGVQLASLQNQLSAELPLLASKRSTATELTRRSVDLKHVVAAQQQALDDLQKECAEQQSNENGEAKSRMEVAVLLEKAKALVAPSAAPSFVQVQALAAATAAAKDVAAQKAAARLDAAQAEPADPLAGARSHLTELAKLLQAGDSKDAAAACSRELKTNQLLKAWKEDELSRLGAEEKAHAQAAEQAQEDIRGVEAAAQTLTERKQALGKFATDGAAVAKKLAQDHTLLTKVVAQATTVLVAAGPKTQLRDAAALLQQVSTQLQQMPEQQEQYVHTIRSAASALQALDTEKAHIKLAESQHQVSLQEMREQASATTKELAQVNAYLEKLQKSCTGSDAKVRREQEVQTVGTAVRELSGAGGTDVVVAPLQPEVAARLTPLQRAAMEMGVPTDGA